MPLTAVAGVVAVKKMAKADGKGGNFGEWEQKAVLQEEGEEEKEAFFSRGGLFRRLRARRR